MKDTMKLLPARFPGEVMEKYVIPDKNGCCGTKGAHIKPDAPQWAKDEYERFINAYNGAAKKGFKI